MCRLPVLVIVAVAGCIVAVALSAGAAGQDRRATAPGDAPLLGMNLNFYRLEGLYCWAPNFVLNDYHLPGVRADLRRSFAAMRAGGVETFRATMIHSHTAGTDWRPMIPSAGGTLPEPYRGNLINLLKDLRALGFVHVQIAFSPMDANQPAASAGAAGIPMVSDRRPGLVRRELEPDPRLRALLKTYGPASTAIDLLNEGAPSDWDSSHRPYWPTYVSRMYANYADAFGNADVTVSAPVRRRQPP